MWRLFIQIKIIHKAGRNGFKLAVLQQVTVKVGMTVPLYAGVLLHTADNIKAALIFSYSSVGLGPCWIIYFSFIQVFFS